MAITFRRCETEQELADVSLFILARRRDLSPSFITLDTLGMLYRYMTQGELHAAFDEEARIVGALALYIGTPESDYTDKQVAYVDMIVLDPARKGTRTFLRFLNYMAAYMREAHPETTHARFIAQSNNAYLGRLYGKFARPVDTRDDKDGQVTIFFGEISYIRDVLSLYYTV